MPWFAKLKAREREQALSLVYRVGIWISHSDDIDGTDDDLVEHQALEAALTKLARLQSAPPIVNFCAQEVLKSRDKWPEWQRHCETVPADCAAILSLLRGKISEKDRKRYRQLLWGLANVVAGSYGEFAQEDVVAPGFFGRVRQRLTAPFRKEEPPPPVYYMNISATEQDALDTLRRALGGGAARG